MRGPPGGSPSIACRRALGDGPHLTFEDIVQALGGGPTQSRRSGRQRRARTMFLSMRQRSAASRPRASARSRSTVLLASHPAPGTPACAALKCSRGAAENVDIAEWNAVELCRRRTTRSSGLPPLRSGWPGGGRLGATSAYVHTTRKPNPGRTARRCHPRRPPTCSAGKRVLGGRFNRARGRGSGSALQGAADQADRTRAGHSIKTADRQVLNAYAKIGVSTRVAATVFAMQHGLAAWGRTPNGWLRRSLLMSPVEHPGTRGVLPRKERAMNGSHGVELSGQDSVGESLGERLPAWVSGAAWAGIIGPVLFTAAFLAQGPFRRGEYDPLAEPVSALQTGPTGWIQQLNFIVFGLLTIAFAIGLNRGLRPTRTGTVGPVLLFVSGIGLLHAAIFPRQYALPLEPMGQREKACVAPRKTDRPIVESH
jgi:hypothetical protein